MAMDEKKARMRELVELLNRAGRAYYQEAREIMDNYVGKYYGSWRL